MYARYRQLNMQDVKENRNSKEAHEMIVETREQINGVMMNIRARMKRLSQYRDEESQECVKRCAQNLNRLQKVKAGMRKQEGKES